MRDDGGGSLTAPLVDAPYPEAHHGGSRRTRRLRDNVPSARLVSTSRDTFVALPAFDTADEEPADHTFARRRWQGCARSCVRPLLRALRGALGLGARGQLRTRSRAWRWCIGSQEPPVSPADPGRCAIHDLGSDGASQALAQSYALEAVIGRGASSTVYRCRKLGAASAQRGGMLFAAKAISKAALGGRADARARQAALARLRREAVLLRRVDHPSIVRLEVAFESEAQLTLVLGLCEGGELFDRLSCAGTPQPLSLSECALVLAQLAAALAYLHGLRIVHRDVKPENILLQQRDSLHGLKLCDFGSAACLEAEGEATGGGDMAEAAALRSVAGGADSRAQRVAEEGPEEAARAHDSCWASFAPSPPAVRQLASMPVGTPGYLPPEARRGRQQGTAADVWALGVVTYLLLAARLPFSPGGLHARRRPPVTALHCARQLRSSAAPPHPLLGGLFGLLCPLVLLLLLRAASPCCAADVEAPPLGAGGAEAADCAEFALDLEAGPWAQVPAESKGTVRSMLSPQPHLRCTAQQVADTHWVCALAQLVPAKPQHPVGTAHSPALQAGAEANGEASAPTGRAPAGLGRHMLAALADSSHEASTGSTPSAASTVEMSGTLDLDEVLDAAHRRRRTLSLPDGGCAPPGVMHADDNQPKHARPASRAKPSWLRASWGR